MPISFTNRFYYILGALAAVFAGCWMLGISAEPGKLLLVLFCLITVVDLFMLFATGKKVLVLRQLSARFSNGDKNEVILQLHNGFQFPVNIQILEELPAQFQARNNSFRLRIPAFGKTNFTYFLRPVSRGEYEFGQTILLVSSGLRLARRRISGAAPQTVKVYPSFMQIRKYQLMATQVQTSEAGQSKVRKIGHSMEFEQIKEYVTGDDIRALNWKASARRGSLMINHFADERSQQVFAIIDKGRLMKMPFDGLTLLDYAINAALVLCNVCLHRQDRFGIISFAHKAGSFLPANRHAAQLGNVLEHLYKINTGFLESDVEKLYMQVRSTVRHRSLLVLFTNFESLSGMRRQLPYLRQLNKYHLLLVVFFENTELAEMTVQPAQDLEAVYTKTIAGKFVMEKRMIVKELSQHGILSMLTAPQSLTVNAVNKYLELKARQAI